MKISKNLLPVVAVAALFSGCQDENLGFTEQDVKEAKFAQTFKEMFGNVDPNQTWSTAARRRVVINLNLSNSFDSFQAKIWTADPSRKSKDLFYMADVKVMNGMESAIAIDAPADLATVYVSLTDETGGSIFVPATFDSEGVAKASFTDEVTRATSEVNIQVLKYNSATDGDNTTWMSYLPAGSDGWGYFSADRYDAYRAVFPENGGNTDNPPCESFVFQSNGSPIVLYPFYSVTAGYGADEIGFFVYDPADGEDYATIVSNPDNYHVMRAGGEGVWECKKSADAGYLGPYVTFTPGQSESAFTDMDIRTRPFVITGVPAGYRVIFALKNAEGYKFSVKELNDPDGTHVTYTGQKDSRFVSGNTYSMVGAATLGGLQYLAFEDTWYPGQYDCQDMAFAVYGGKMVDLNSGSGTAMGFMVAYEDLGNTYDMDFNDIVIKVSHVATTIEGAAVVDEDVTVTLLAAGGTLNVVPKYNRNAIFAGKGNDTDNTGEAHAVFGFEVSQPVNVGENSAPAFTSTISCKSNESIAEVAAKITMELTSTSDMEFTRKVSYCIDGDQRTSNIPYAILISSPSWEWPTEEITITTVYPSFKNWVCDATASSWYGASWDGGTAATSQHMSVLSGNTFYESASISNIDPDFVTEYTTNGTTLHFAFGGYTANSTATIKSENGQLEKTITIGTEGKASLALTGEEFSKILYKTGTTKANFFLITAYATSYGVNFGSEAEISGTDLNNVYSELLASDGTKATLTTYNNQPFITADQLLDYQSVVLTVRTYNNAQYNYLNIYSPIFQNSEISCTNNEKLTENMVAVPGRNGIYTISLTAEQLSKYTSPDPYNASNVNGIVFNGFKNLEVAISGVEKATPVLTVPATLSLTDGETSQLTPSNTGKGTSYTYSSSNADVASVDANGLITAGSTSGTAVITVTLAATDTYKSASATVNVTVTVDSRQASDLQVASSAKSMTVEDTYTLVKGTDFTTSSTGAVSYSSSDETVATVTPAGLITAVSAGTAVITIEVEGDETYKKGSKTITLTVSAKKTASGTTTYEGDDLTAILSGLKYIIPASACQANSSITVTFTTAAGWTKYYCTVNNTWDAVFTEGTYPINTTTSSETETACHVSSSKLSEVAEKGISLLNEGSIAISKIVVVAE